ncbi:cysteine--tRNA ligase [Hyphomicrobium sp.]|uniref:cysteine--tRNA ligase n=1 Tax=Hyphomicrobium sp. TaxID=82 RepID=UPI002E33DE20|nr:cysteine--tRNA ligase [Hyphomicrobium sp.]HEX2842471.1 cysteine--tRNA ligase [Hyphomicrobium sp.]
MSLTLYNTLTRRKEPFEPIDPANVRMYVCGPTVYDYAHIGNARPVIVFDVLYRLLRHIYGPEHVTYVRNITDVDDKINARAGQDYPNLPLNEAIRRVTSATEKQFHDDIAALGVLPPSVEPRATEHIEEMKTLCEALVARGHAYVAQGHVLFDVSSMPDYGKLSNRSLEEMEAGARVEVAPYKKGPMDFVLWKPSKPGEPAWPSPAGIAEPGRPGWHIECSAMSEKHLGPVFDIHGGGIDLVFPHHENEIAQSRCAHGLPVMANVWMHNGFLQVEGEKMSKSLGNFITINELLATKKFGANQWHGRVVRLAMLGTHYRQPIDWTAERLLQARATLLDFADLLSDIDPASEPNADVIAALSDDLNTPSALSIVYGLAKSAKRNPDTAAELRATLEFIGVYGGETREELNVGIESVSVDADIVDSLVAARLAARRAKDFKESDRIRDELAAMGVALKDAKDPKTGEIVTTWEIAR